MRTAPNRRMAPRDRQPSRGFTLIEMMVTLMVMAVVMVVMMTVMYAVSRNRTAQMNRMNASQSARTALDMMARDLRSAGYGTDLAGGQNPIAYIDSTQVLICENLLPYPDTASAGHQQPLAYNPTGFPRPKPLNGTTWQPGSFTSGAEIVRWTLDANNDGVIDASDVTGTDAEQTKNPNDFVLFRQVYGDMSGGVAGNNGGAQSTVALIRKPGGAVAPMFTVYFKNVSAPWNWSSGPVPPSQLGNIQRIVVTIVAPSAHPNQGGTYEETKYTTSVSEMRNIPSLGSSLSAVDGFVYEDKDHSRTYTFGDVPIPSVQVRCGLLTAYTNSSGYYLIQAAPGSYTVKHTPLENYGSYSSPDSAIVTVPPGTSFSFADTARAGGFVTLNAFEDSNNNAVQDYGELPKDGVKFTLTPGGVSKTTNSSGTVSIFAPTGGYSIVVTPPDTFQVTTANPITGTMTDGGSAAYAVGVHKVPMAQISGKVFTDLNRNGVYDAGEPGMSNVWVGVTTDGGYTVPGFAYSDVNGDYTINAPANDPPRTTPYSIMCIPAAGYFATTTTSINNVYLTGGAILSSQNFGIAAFQIISLITSRVLSLGSANLWENDYSSKINKATHDVDIILGAEAVGTDQISVWFNNYDGSPLFPSTRTYARTAPQSVLCLTPDSLYQGPLLRGDLVTGTKVTAAGNFFTWYAQSNSGNEGYYPTSYSQAYKTQDAGDVQAILTYDCTGGTGHDIIVGTNAGSYRGTIEIWKNSDPSSGAPTFTRDQIIPPAGFLSSPPTWLGEVTSMVLADLDGDGNKDLVVGTKTGATGGEVDLFQFTTKTLGLDHFVYRSRISTAAWVDAVTCLDIDGDGKQDIVVGQQTSTSSGTLTLYKQAGVSWSYTASATVSAPGIPLTLASADLLGTSRKDVIVGYRETTTSYVGGVRIYPTDSGTLPASGYDPSGGQVVNMVPAMTINNFNYGTYPVQPPPPYLADLAVGVKISDTTGALVVMIR